MRSLGRSASGRHRMTATGPETAHCEDLREPDETRANSAAARPRKSTFGRRRRATQASSSRAFNDFSMSEFRQHGPPAYRCVWTRVEGDRTLEALRPCACCSATRTTRTAEAISAVAPVPAITARSAVAAIVISASIIWDGWRALQIATAELVDGIPRELGDDKLAEDAAGIARALKKHFPKARVLMRETGRYIHAEVVGATPPKGFDFRKLDIEDLDCGWRLDSVAFRP